VKLIGSTDFGFYQPILAALGRGAADGQDAEATVAAVAAAVLAADRGHRDRATILSYASRPFLIRAFNSSGRATFSCAAPMKRPTGNGSRRQQQGDATMKSSPASSATRKPLAGRAAPPKVRTSNRRANGHDDTTTAAPERPLDAADAHRPGRENCRYPARRHRGGRWCRA